MQSYAEYLNEQGEARGEVSGERRLLLRQGSGRFGPPDAKAMGTLEAINSTEILEQLGLRIFEVESWQELLRNVPDNGQPADTD